MKKKWLSVAAVASAMLLVGCSSGDTKEKDSPAKESTTQSAKAQDYSFYKDAKTNERIYYKVDLDKKSFGKDSIITNVLHIDHGDYTYFYVGSNHTMSDLKGLSDKEILTAAEKWSEETALNLVEKAKKEANETLEKVAARGDYKDDIDKNNETLAHKNLEILNTYKYEKPQPRKLQIKAESDESGNNLAKEWVVLPTNDFKIRYYVGHNWFNDLNTEDIQAYYQAKLIRYQLSPTQQTADVYDKTYSLSSFGPNATMATEGTDIMKLDDLDESGMLDKDADSPYYSTEKGDDNENFITWE